VKFLVTGAAGFIGNFVAERLCLLGHSVVGIDNINDYYCQQLKWDRLQRLEPLSNFRFIKMDIVDKCSMAGLFESEVFDRVIHLAAQAGVRYSLENPAAYIESNVVGFLNVLEGCRHNAVKHLVYASSSSVYGMNKKIPFSTKDAVDHPVSLYAATKKSNELMAHTYSHLYGLPTTGLRFFTVYGPWGRPDMAPFLFVDAISNNKPIKVFNGGAMQRDFTYIDDIVEGILRVQDTLPEPDRECDGSPLSRIFNIGNGNPVELEKFIYIIEQSLGKCAIKNYLSMQDGDVVTTYADVTELEKITGFKPATDLVDGIKKFTVWYEDYYVNNNSTG